MRRMSYNKVWEQELDTTIGWNVFQQQQNNNSSVELKPLSTDFFNKCNHHVLLRHDRVVEHIPYYMKFWRHFYLANLAIFAKIAKLKCIKIKCRQI